NSLRVVSNKKAPPMGGALMRIGGYFFFFVAFFFAGAFFFVAIINSPPILTSLYDYCSPLTGKLLVKNIFKTCHIKIQSKNDKRPRFLNESPIGYHAFF